MRRIVLGACAYDATTHPRRSLPTGGPAIPTTIARSTPRDAVLRQQGIFRLLLSIAVVFVFVQFFTSSEFVHSQDPATHIWIVIHGFTAYGVLVPAAAAAAIAATTMRRTARAATAVSIALLLAAVGQWGTGHLISTFGLNGWIPFHIFFSSFVLALAVWATVIAVRLRPR